MIRNTGIYFLQITSLTVCVLFMTSWAWLDGIQRLFDYGRYTWIAAPTFLNRSKWIIFSRSRSEKSLKHARHDDKERVHVGSRQTTWLPGMFFYLKWSLFCFFQFNKLIAHRNKECLMRYKSSIWRAWCLSSIWYVFLLCEWFARVAYLS